MYMQRHVKEWWETPRLPDLQIRAPRNFLDKDPTDPDIKSPFRPRSKIGGFSPKRKWVPYNRLQPVDAGYVVPLYDLNDIGKRFGLSHAGKRYYRQYILPEPYDIVRRRSVSAHHWSRFVLMAMDEVLHDLEKRGRLQLLKTYTDHIDLIHKGAEYMADYYTEKAELEPYEKPPKYGVEWVDDP